MLDPACGSGNFLYLALLGLKDLEHRANLDAEALGLERQFPAVGPECVRGIEINPYAAELARVTVWIGEIQWMRRNGFDVARKPLLRPLDTIECRDALLNPDGSEAEWPAADATIGNPPFLGSQRMLGVLGESYTARLRKAYAGRVPAGVDLVTYWFEKTQAEIAPADMGDDEILRRLFEVNQERAAVPAAPAAAVAQLEWGARLKLKPLATAVVLAALPLPAGAGELRITVEGIRSAQGTVLIGLYDSPESFARAIDASDKEGFLIDPHRFGAVALRANAAMKSAVVFSNLEPGRYAVIAFHDENGNGQLDQNFPSVPAEPYGFSNNAEGFLNPPSFDAAAMVLGEGDSAIRIALILP